MPGRLLDLVRKVVDRSGIDVSLAVIWSISFSIIVKECTFLKENVLVESKRANPWSKPHLWNRERKKRLKIIMSNYYAPGAVLDVGGTRMTSTQFLPWKYPQFVQIWDYSHSSSFLNHWLIYCFLFCHCSVLSVLSHIWLFLTSRKCRRKPYHWERKALY